MIASVLNGGLAYVIACFTLAAIIVAVWIRRAEPLPEQPDNLVFFPARLRAVEDALDEAGDEAGGVVFEWPDAAA